jgi:hypothetical protein
VGEKSVAAVFVYSQKISPICEGPGEVAERQPLQYDKSSNARSREGKGKPSRSIIVQEHPRYQERKYYV